MYDRCPECNAMMTFHAITSVQGVWRRWTECTHCKIYVSTDSLGGSQATQKSEPPKKALARNEVLADAGSAVDRFGQDFVRDMPGLQPIRRGA